MSTTESVSDPAGASIEQIRSMEARAYARGRRDAASAIEQYALDRRKGFLWAQTAIELALGDTPRTE